jgi:cyclophilin family peptidyl-prolyl cis-trans isomerase
MLVVISMLFISVSTAQAADPGKSPAPAKSPAAAKAPRVVVKTSLGEMTLELYPDKAPISVKNFLDYVDAKFYDGTVFHRIIATFMIQGGGFGTDMQQKPTRAPIKNEAGNGLKNTVGTLAMARTNVVDSATAQFFINTVDNAFLDHRDETPAGFGYAVFGKVVNGMDVVKKIAAVPTGARDVPTTAVVIESVRVAP